MAGDAVDNGITPGNNNVHGSSLLALRGIAVATGANAARKNNMLGAVSPGALTGLKRAALDGDVVTNGASNGSSPFGLPSITNNGNSFASNNRGLVKTVSKFGDAIDPAARDNATTDLLSPQLKPLTGGNNPARARTLLTNDPTLSRTAANAPASRQNMSTDNAHSVNTFRITGDPVAAICIDPAFAKTPNDTVTSTSLNATKGRTTIRKISTFDAVTRTLTTINLSNAVVIGNNSCTRAVSLASAHALAVANISKTRTIAVDTLSAIINAALGLLNDSALALNSKASHALTNAVDNAKD